jgi:hypothetical protein
MRAGLICHTAEVLDGRTIVTVFEYVNVWLGLAMFIVDTLFTGSTTIRLWLLLDPQPIFLFTMENNP